jgi:hypothetical protein
MAAGQGFKTFTSGDVLTAADVNGYLMQGVNVFANATERDAEITSPQEGQFAYLKDTNVTTYYTGSAWANLDTTGMVNPMTTTGDTIYSSSGSTPARLGIGSTGQVLTVAGGVPTWATASGGGKSFTLLNTGGTALSGVSTLTVSGISAKDDIYIIINGASAGAFATTSLTINADTSSKYGDAGFSMQVPATFTASRYSTYDHAQNGTTNFSLGSQANNVADEIACSVRISGAASTNTKMVTVMAGASNSSASGGVYRYYMGSYTGSSAVSSITITSDSGNYDAGTIYVYTSA